MGVIVQPSMLKHADTGSKKLAMRRKSGGPLTFGLIQEHSAAFMGCNGD